ncbi:MAG: helix-turn-helix domain-containing protein [Opitutales bacterium]
MPPRGRPTKSPRSDFGKRVRELRLKSGLSQQEVADQLGIGQPSYADWERRNVAISADQIKRLAEIFAVPVQELFSDEDSKSGRTGPVGRAQRAFTELSELPRPRQKELLEIIERLIYATKERSEKASLKKAS